MQNIYNPKIHKRRSVRLKDYDYSQAGAYFVTICINNRESLFGNVSNDKMILNDAGLMITNLWIDLDEKYTGFTNDSFIVMPNHFHGIIWKNEPKSVGVAPCGYPDDMTLSDIIHRYKSLTTNKYIRGVKNNNWSKFTKRLWQRNFYEHVIRSEIELNTIREYILDNPRKWHDDKYYSE